MSTDRSFGYPVKNDYLPGGLPGQVGSGGTAKLTWKTNQPYISAGHTHRVTLEYKRGDNGPPAKTFSFAVEIG